MDKRFSTKFNALHTAMFTLCFGATAVAHAEQNSDSDTATLPSPIPITQANLGQITVVGKRLTRKSEDSTGLGKTIKSQDDIKKAQILSIRDLVRDTAGVAVVEQGRGASSGYTMRGVDKNRVAVNVDGIAQIQSYLVQKRQTGDGREGSGAINEIELENVSGVQISQGAAGTESGSGALGGAVAFRTKSAADMLDDDKQHTFFYKTSFASKDNHRVHSLGAAWQIGAVDALLQYTERNKTQAISHKDISKTRYDVWRFGIYPIDLQNGVQQLDNDPKRTFVLVDECPSYIQGDKNSIVNCVKPKLKLTAVKENMSAAQYTGNQRIMPDPMRAKSDSLFAKVGYTLSPSQRLQMVIERTKQSYDSQDMTKEAYHLLPKKGEGALANSSLYYRGKNYSEGYNSEGVVDKLDHTGIGAWTQTQFFDEKHSKNRYGIAWDFNNNDGKNIIDSANISLDKQVVGIDHLQIEKYCAPYPTIDRNCTASADKPNSAERQNRMRYQEDHTLLRADINKRLHMPIHDSIAKKIGLANNKIRHDINIKAGMDRFRSLLWIGDIQEKYHLTTFDFVEDLKNPAGEFVDVVKFKQHTAQVDICKDWQQYIGEARKCGDRPITGYNNYFAIKDTMRLGKYADASIGVRLDKHSFTSNDSWTGVGNYQNASWNGGVVIKPNQYINIAYRASSGYRVPSFKELFGYRPDGNVKGQDDKKHYRTNVNPERALNQELGLVIKGDKGNLELSYFDNRYRDLIALTLKDDKWGYRNYQDVQVIGMGLSGMLDTHELFAKAPPGLIAKVGFLHSEVHNNRIKKGFSQGDSYFLDAISPDRYVFGLDYNHDDGKWGASASWIFHEAKSVHELVGMVQSPAGAYQTAVAPLPSRPYNLLDIMGFYQFNRHLTVRGGINNVLDTKYSAWESMRQSAITQGNQHQKGLPSQYVGSGRNFSLTMEAKF